MNTNNWGDVFMPLVVVAGGEMINVAPNNGVYMAQRPNGFVYFNTLPGRYFRLLDYDWSGPMFNTVVTTNEQGITRHKERGKSREKGRRKGGLMGAAIGTMLMPGVGTAIGYAMTSKTVTKGKQKSRGKSVTNNTTVTNENQVEANSVAKIELADVETGRSFSIGIVCNSSIDIELDGFVWPNDSEAVGAQQLQAVSESERIAALKEYKGLLDAGVLTQEEFEAKKLELLGGNNLSIL